MFNLRRIQIPIEFILENDRLLWSDILFGYSHCMLKNSDVILYANSKINIHSSDMEIELAYLDESDTKRIKEVLTDLASELCPFSEKKWLYLNLLCLYNNRNSLENPFELINMIYADFNYPEEIASFISYMPPKDGYNPSLHSKDENRNRLFQNWHNYLLKTKKELALS